MVCQECGQRPATLHFTKIVNGEKTEVHLCEQCAHDKGDMFMFPGSADFSIHNLLAGLLNMEPPVSDNQTQHNAFESKEVLQCDRCKMTFQQFKKVGRFGCSQCYSTFSEQLSPILRRLHSGNTYHGGKIPTRIGGTLHLRKELDNLKQSLQNHIQREEFELAAEVRDKIRTIERRLKTNRGEDI
ncbi:hypothetical protein EJF36_00515 [Bacillus sp. HMF5848]|uniref:UvrB/UvrC motif-containing protein n=1 Tax=Bacillus sp. HMF5848 TaxID=2495421 RepID=UPI000F7B487B|nr:UvrB/UvrC motif-containing protein [Bacillus sp. HMF5848]RSK25517.1 hypothetical protein EJF36_00515 [Bacillus sp. HMF5848]